MSIACVSILGHFGEGKTLLNGQTVKTKILTEELCEQLGKEQVVRIDTHGGIRTLFKAPFQVLRALKQSRNVMILPAQNGVRVYAPLLSLFRNLFRGRKLHYVVIGGWLPEFLKQRKRLAAVLKMFDKIYVETQTMKRALEEQGFGNVIVMPNCKRLHILTEDELIYPTEKPYRLCTFSRVMKEKGIEDAVDAVISINTKRHFPVFTLDIYGAVESSQTEWFETLKKTFPDYIHYRGAVPFHETTEILKEYFALLFPTYYEGEGFAGTFLDAYSAGIPVIATDWRYNPELVSEDTGFLYPTQRQDILIDILEGVVQNPAELYIKKSACLKKASEYQSDQVIRILINQLQT